MRTEILKNITTKIGSGATPTGGQNAYHGEGIPLIRSQNVLDFTFSKNGLAFINEEQARELNNVTVEENDILLNITGDSIARACIVPKDILPARVNQHVSIIRADETVNSKYLFYYLQYLKSYLLKICGVGGTRNALTKEVIGELEICISENQNKIAAILTSIDDKISLNNRINAELEQMAKTIYNYWFVQFDFPNEEGKPYKASGGAMEYNEELKREIPKGWEIKSLSEIENNIVTGKTPLTENDEYYNGEIPFITIPDIRGNIFIINTEKRLTKLGANTQQNKFLPVDAICVSCIASPGLVGFVTEPSQTNQQINSVVCHDEVNKFYLYFAIKEYFENSFGAKIGNTFVNMNKEEFSEIKLVYPKHNVLQEYHALISDKFELVKNKSFENQELITLRDFLLPLLMNGQVKVK